MDLSNFDTRQTAKDGKWFDLKVGGNVAMGSDNEPVKFKLRGSDEPTVKTKLLAIQGRADGSAPIENEDRDFAAMVLMEWSDNFTLNGADVPEGREGAKAIAEIPLMQGFIIATMANRLNFTTQG